jgi:hypothetical protein
METSQSTAKLMAMAALVLATGVAHFAYDPAIVAPIAPDPGSLTLIPANIGDYSLQTHINNPVGHGAVEQAAIFLDSKNHGIAQISLLLNSGAHDGLDCYLAHGLAAVWQGTEEVQALDSTAYFSVAVLQGNSIDASAGGSFFLIGRSECDFDRCAAEADSRKPTGLFRAPATDSLRIPTVPVSIVLQPPASRLEASATGRRDILLREFRQFVYDLPLRPLREFARAEAPKP